MCQMHVKGNCWKKHGRFDGDVPSLMKEEMAKQQRKWLKLGKRPLKDEPWTELVVLPEEPRWPADAIDVRVDELEIEADEMDVDAISCSNDEWRRRLADTIENKADVHDVQVGRVDANASTKSMDDEQRQRPDVDVTQVETEIVAVGVNLRRVAEPVPVGRLFMPALAPAGEVTKSPLPSGALDIVSQKSRKQPVPPPPSGSPSHMHGFWAFVAQALLGERATDLVCRTFELGGTIDSLGDVAFARDQITAPFLTRGDLASIVWHCMLMSWLGSGGPRQGTYCWLREEGLARPYDETESCLVHEIYRRVERRKDELGWGAVFAGDSRAVKFRLNPKQQGEDILHAWHDAVPRIVDALESEGASSEHLDRVLRSVAHVGELTSKELIVFFHYARPAVADTTRFIPVGVGAREGARLVLSGEPFHTNKTCDTACSREPGTCYNLFTRGGLEAVRVVAAQQDWALEHVLELASACRSYQLVAPHRRDPRRNCRVVRPQLLDLADVEVMLCYYTNYLKLRARYGDGPVPLGVCPRGWARRHTAPDPTLD